MQTRLTTVLPIVRELSFGATIAITALIVLSAVGVDIGPLLAGFGIIGLALSFGSQALVKDIVSGIFFMTDDAFRVGEYIDTGKLKGHGRADHPALRAAPGIRTARFTLSRSARSARSPTFCATGRR